MGDDRTRQKDLWVTEEGLAAMVDRQCIKEPIEPEDMVGPCLFLASKAARDDHRAGPDRRWRHDVSIVPFLVAVDWGTSSFRLWLMSADGTVLAEHRSHEGMNEVADRGFETILEGHLRGLSAPKGLPVVICGMAGSRQGWVEAGYLDTPADVAAIGENATRIPGTSREIIIIPGLSVRSLNEPDVMRGEETQLLGACLEMPAGGRYCMPGTHSKWVTMKGLRGHRFRILYDRRIVLRCYRKNDSGAFDRWRRPRRRALTRPLQAVCAMAGHGPN
jgi:hypothetical protein